MSANAQKNRLGRGIASLIGDVAPSEGTPLPAEGEHRVVPIEQVRPSHLNPRKDFVDEDLDDLANSIRTKGLVQPLIVRPSNGLEGGFEIVAGERRWRASQKAELSEIPVVVRDLTDRQLLEIAIIENVQRADLNAVEEALGYQELVDRFSYTQDELSSVIGKSRSHVANMLRLLKLPEDIQAYVRNGDISAGHARCLVGVENAADFVKEIISKGLSVRDVEALVQTGLQGSAGKAKKGREKDADTKAFEKELTDSLGLKVQVKLGSGENGELRIRYTNFEQLDEIRNRLLKKAMG
jgi:ParB family chromosome partitioning protein